MISNRALPGSLLFIPFHSLECTVGSSNLAAVAEYCLAISMAQGLAASAASGGQLDMQTLKVQRDKPNQNLPFNNHHLGDSYAIQLLSTLDVSSYHCH